MKRKFVRKVVKPRKVNPKKRKLTGRAGLVKLIKNVALKTQETKMTQYSFAYNMQHNVSQRISQNALATTQGTGDGVSSGIGSNYRVGDTVMPIGVKFMFQFRQYADRPNVTWKIWVVKTMGQDSLTSLPVKAITGNLMLDPIDTEKVTVLKTRTYKYTDNYWQGTLGTSKETNYFAKLWVPLKRVNYVYHGDNLGQGKLWQMAVYAAAYDSYGSLVTDNLGTLQFTQCFYFKDS